MAHYTHSHTHTRTFPSPTLLWPVTVSSHSFSSMSLQSGGVLPVSAVSRLHFGNGPPTPHPPLPPGGLSGSVPRAPQRTGLPSWSGPGTSHRGSPVTLHTLRGFRGDLKPSCLLPLLCLEHSLLHLLASFLIVQRLTLATSSAESRL